MDLEPLVPSSDNQAGCEAFRLLYLWFIRRSGSDKLPDWYTFALLSVRFMAQALPCLRLLSRMSVTCQKLLQDKYFLTWSRGWVPSGMARHPLRNVLIS